MKKAIKVTIKIINTLIVTAAVVLAFLIVGVRLFGVQLYAVLSGSMEPEYPVGALIYVVEAEPETLAEGDVITFQLSGSTVATHRIVEVLPDEDDPDAFQYRTKGDANEHEDAGLVHSDQLIGRPIAVIPQLGYFASYIQEPPGSYTACAVMGALILFVFVTDSFTNDKKKKQQKLDGE